mgnify:CR=1 FL=1
MNKILITLVVPMIDKEYDLFIPISKKIYVAKKLLIEAVNELSEGHYPIKDKCTLLSTTGIPFDDKKTIKESQIKNGDRIILI